MPRYRSLLIGLTVIALSAASLAAVCGNADTASTRKAARPGSLAASDANTPQPAMTITSGGPSVTPEPTAAPSAATPDAQVRPTATPQPKTFRGPAVTVPTPSSPSDPMVFAADLWVDGASQRGEVIASIVGNECGRGLDVGGFFLITVASDAQQPGCGTPGGQVTITANGRPMDDKVEWQPGYQAQRLSLFAGPLVGRYGGNIRLDRSLRPERVVAYVGDTVCGSTADLRGNGEIASYELVVAPEVAIPGCGRESASVTLRLEGITGDGEPFDSYITTVPWLPGPPTLIPDVDLSGQIPGTPVATAASGQ